MLKHLKNMFNKKEKRLKKLELDVMELQLQELQREIERFENEGNNLSNHNVARNARASQFNKGL